jgi:hypothetical protein
MATVAEMQEHIAELAAELDVEWHWVDGGTVATDAGPGRCVFRAGDRPLIRCEPIRDRRNYFTALHELGLVAVAPADWLDLDGGLDLELATWEWALDNARFPVTPTVANSISDQLADFMERLRT